MKRKLNSEISELIVGSTYLGTGGGGLPEEGRKIYADLLASGTELILATLDEFPPEAVFVSGFAVGSVASSISSAEPLRQAFEALKREIKAPIAGVIPVEIGPKALALGFYLATAAGVPLLDADVVGGRSTPEVFLETITLFGIKRTPSVAVSSSGDLALLLESSSAAREEAFFRSFAANNGGQCYVVGYVLTAAQIREAVETGTVTEALNAGHAITQNRLADFEEAKGAKTLLLGTISGIEETTSAGFFSRNVLIDSAAGKARLYVKNENLILWLNDKLVLSCPDLIILLDTNSGLPIYNADLRPGLEIRIVGYPARSRWRSAAGQQLFGPKTFGFNQPVALLR